MPLAEVIRTAWLAIARHPLRSVLTMLGVSIGVGAFICSVAVGEGASSQIEEQIHSLGDNMIWIEAGNRNVNGVRTGIHGTKSLMLGDAKAIQDQVPLVGHVTPNVDLRVAMVFRNRNWVGQVRGVSPEYLAGGTGRSRRAGCSRPTRWTTQRRSVSSVRRS